MPTCSQRVDVSLGGGTGWSLDYEVEEICRNEIHYLWCVIMKIQQNGVYGTRVEILGKTELGEIWVDELEEASVFSSISWIC